MCHTNCSRHVRLCQNPFFPHKLYQKVCLELKLLPKKTFYTFCASIGPSYNTLQFYHGLVGRTSNNYKSSVTDADSQYVDTMASVDGHVLPIHVHRAEGQFSDPYLDTESLIVLPPCHILISLFHRYDEQLNENKNRISFNVLCIFQN